MFNRSTVYIVPALAYFLAMLAPAGNAAAQEGWPMWRGPHATGAAAGNPPVEWSETKNVKWKVALPGHGDSTPVVWGDKMFVLSAIAEGGQSEVTEAEGGGQGGPAPGGPYKFNVICLDRNTGAILWNETAREETPHEGRHPSGSYASNSPVTDGQFVWASFGSRGLHCYDVSGKKIWERDLGKLQIKRGFGEGASPILAGEAIIVKMDHEGGSRIAAFDKSTGEPLWEQNREEGTSWSSPAAVDAAGIVQIVTTATNRIRSYDAATGAVLWEEAGLTQNVIPTPVFGDGLVYCMSGFRGYALKAIRVGEQNGKIAWEGGSGTPYVSSPLLYEDMLYFVDGLNPILSCYDAKTGIPIFADQRIEGLANIYASPVGAGGRIYIADREGNVAVLKKSGSLEIVASNSLDDGFDASPVVVGDALYLRGEKNLYCIEEG